MKKKPKRKKTVHLLPFKDNKGNVLMLNGDMTIGELYKMGVEQIRIAKKGAKLSNGWWRDMS